MPKTIRKCINLLLLKNIASHKRSFLVKSFLTVVLILLILVTLIFRINAEINSQPINVSVNVVANCVIRGNGMSNINFGIFNMPSFHKSKRESSTTYFSVVCTKGTHFSVEINQGNYSSHSIRRAGRAMFNDDKDYLSYELYTSSDKSVIWKSTNNAIYEAKSISPYLFTVYAYVPPGQYIGEGNYRDTFMITIKFYPTSVAPKNYYGLVSIQFLPDIASSRI